MTPYNPSDWHWIVGGDESRFWSSAAAAYVETLPEGAYATRIASEELLWDVLRRWHPAGLPTFPPTSEDVNVERARRIEQGTIISVTGHVEPIYVQGRDEDTRNLQGLATAAFARMSQADSTTITSFRDGNNDMHDLVPGQVFEMWQTAASYVEAIYAASWALKAMVPIPADYATNDVYWP